VKVAIRIFTGMCVRNSALKLRRIYKQADQPADSDDFVAGKGVLSVLIFRKPRSFILFRIQSHARKGG
jgi:hypothetical protein